MGSRTEVIETKTDEKTQKNSDPDMSIQASSCVTIKTETLQPPPPSSSSSSEVVQAVPMAVSAVSSALTVVVGPQEKVDKLDSNEPVYDASRAPISDGYSWRKYGQKQVKSVGSFRSYYRCTNPSCCARKKVQHIDLSGEIIDVIYKGNHNHDPPPKFIKGFGRKRFSIDSSAPTPDGPCVREFQKVVQLKCECQESTLNSTVNSLTNAEEQDIKKPDTTLKLKSGPSTSPAEGVAGTSSRSNELALINTMNERDIPIKKRRIKEEDKPCPENVYKTLKDPKIVVHPGGDAGVAADGYRWRKYGQKMVKGNLYPRSYYRCATVGCPVRRHVERASDGSSAIVALYDGEHNHDMPLPKKQHCSPKPSAPLNASVDAANNADAVNNVPLLLCNEKSLSQSLSQGTPAPHCRDLHSDVGEEKKATSNVGGDQVIESANTLLTIGIKLESC